MATFTFQKLDQSMAKQILPKLFSILHANMSFIAPTGLRYEEDEAIWLSYMLPKMEQPYPEIILMYADDVLAGYTQYSISGTSLMIEEVEIKPEYRRTMLFYRMCQNLISRIPNNILYIESYVNKQNLYSMKINQKLGLEIIGENISGKSWHLQGEIQKLRAYCSRYTI